MSISFELMSLFQAHMEWGIAFECLHNEYVKSMQASYGYVKEHYALTDDMLIVFAVRQGLPIGFAATCLGDAGTLWVCQVYVAPPHRKQGIYRAMMQEVDGIALHNDCHTVVAIVFNENEGSHAAHKALGFSPQATMYEKLVKKP